MANNTSLKGKRTQEESLKTQAKILDEAEHLFVKVGYGVSIREIAKASGVRHHTVQYHFGNKEQLYKAVLQRWDKEVERRLLTAIEDIGDISSLKVVIDAAVEVIFDFFLEKREWVALMSITGINRIAVPTEILTTQAKAMTTSHLHTSETLDEGTVKPHPWLNFIEKTIEDNQWGTFDFDLRLLLITIEGIAHNHILAQSQYESLFGKDVTDEALSKKTKAHLKKVIHVLLGVSD